MSVPYVHNKGNNNELAYVVVFVGKPVRVGKNDTRYKAILEAIAKDATEQDIKDILDAEMTADKYIDVVNKSGVKLEIKNNDVFLNGEQLHNSIASRVIDFVTEGLPFEHLLKFIKNISDNPSYRAQTELYDFLEYKDLPITEDGHLLAYKSVRPDYKDWHSNSFDNSPGQELEMPRGKVDDNRDIACSKGFHAGSIQYVKGFYWGQGHVVVVKINPRDVVSVPKDSDCQKVRVCKYVVLSDMTSIFDRPLYDAAGNEVIGREGVDMEYSPNWSDIDEVYQDDYEDDFAYDDDEDDTDWSDIEEDEDEDDTDYDSLPVPQPIL